MTNVVSALPPAFDDYEPWLRVGVGRENRGAWIPVEDLAGRSSHVLDRLLEESGPDSRRADSFASSVLTDLGLTLAGIVADTSGDMVPLSFERIDDLDADILFWQIRQTDDGLPDEEGVAQVTSSPLWGDATGSGQRLRLLRGEPTLVLPDDSRRRPDRRRRRSRPHPGLT